MVLRQLEIQPDISLKDCQKVVPGLKKDNFYKIKRQLKNKSKQSKKSKPRGSTQRGNADHSSNNAPPSHPPTFIDDPDELLMSVAKRMLNKPDPDPRWANILLSCRKENITSTNEVMEELQKASTSSLVNILKRSSHVGQA